MSDLGNLIEDLTNELKEERDALKVKLHLAKLDAGDEWKKIEHQLEKLEMKAKDVRDATAEASKDVFSAAKLLGEEIRDGLKKVAKRF